MTALSYHRSGLASVAATLTAWPHAAGTALAPVVANAGRFLKSQGRGVSATKTALTVGLLASLAVALAVQPVLAARICIGDICITTGKGKGKKVKPPVEDDDEDGAEPNIKQKQNNNNANNGGGGNTPGVTRNVFKIPDACAEKYPTRPYLANLCRKNAANKANNKPATASRGPDLNRCETQKVVPGGGSVTACDTGPAICGSVRNGQQTCCCPSAAPRRIGKRL